MNIFYLHSDPKVCAEWAVDKHVVKMILEAAQLLSTAHRVLDGKESVGVSQTGRKKKIWVLPDERNDTLYSATHVNHPSAIWARETNNNYTWLWCYLYEHCKEYTYRYGKVHKIEATGLLETLKTPPHNIFVGSKTLIPSAMDAIYVISKDPVVNYRNYYKYGKEHLHSWKKREAPPWI